MTTGCLCPCLRTPAFAIREWNMKYSWVMLDIGFQWKLGRRWQIRRISPCPFIPINPPKIISRHHLHIRPPTNTPASPGFVLPSEEGRGAISEPGDVCAEETLQNASHRVGSPPGAASYENRGRIVPTVDTLLTAQQGVSKWQPDSSRIFVINKSHYICLWLAGRQK